ncbi:MAG: protoporphyrinogen oxidase, partial [Bryobacterales bacterium]|nr:protoporphyrinogen oxidase [Bryobacterales bacterium]
MMIPTKIPPMIFTPLLGWGTKIRMGLDYFRGVSAEVPPERSVAEFIRDHYGQETVDYLADPLLSGVYGGTAEALSVDAVLPRFVDMERKYGSLTKGALAARKHMPKGGESAALFRTLKRGLGSLVAAIESKLEGVRRITGEVEALDRAETGAGWRVRVGREWLAASQVILAVPAYASGALLRHLDPEAARLLETVDYSSSATVALAYRPGRLQQALKGFGFLVPRVEGRTLRALTVVQNKFPNRAPEGYNLLRCFLGGAGRQAILDAPDEVLLEAVMYDLRRMLGIREQPDHIRINRWHRGMAQYTLGHGNRMGQAQARVKALGGIHLAGNAYSGIGIPDCIRTGQQAAAACVVK